MLPVRSYRRSDTGAVGIPPEGAINGPMFLAYVKQCLVPTLKRGNIVIISVAISLSLTISRPTRSPTVVDAMEAVGATLDYLPPGSPDLNPIELSFSSTKPAEICSPPLTAPLAPDRVR